MNIAHWLHARALSTPAAPALFTGTKLEADYRCFAARACALARHLETAHGLKQGDRVALYLPNRADYLILMYAVWWLGGVIVPINYKLHAREAAWIATNARAALLFSDGGAALAQQRLPDGCRELGLDSGSVQAILSGDHSEPLAAPRALQDDALAWLFYTSGTTGRPKGVMLSHGNLMAMSLCYPLDVDDVHSCDAALYAAPMSHGAGLYNFVFVRCGARHVVPCSRGFDSAEILSLAAELENVSMFAAPTMLKRMVRQVQSDGGGAGGIRTVVLGGGPMYAADLIEALDVMGPKFAQIYGQGESPMTITAMRREAIADRSQPDWAHRIASVGTAQSCMEVRVVDADLRDMPVGECGEVVTRGTAVMQGYWENPSATAQTLVDGWLRTGDIGFLNADGFLTLTDRSKDVIISGGTNIYPREVEEVLARHPDVFETAVVGAPHPEWGEEVVAFVVVRAGRTLDAAALEAWCRDEIASFKKPRRYVWCDELPKNSYGKVLKTALREQAG